MALEPYPVGDVDRHILLTNHEPTPPSRRPSDQWLLKLAVDNGWPRDEDVLIDMLSVLLAESGGDPKGYLAYIDLGADRHGTIGKNRWDLIDLYDKNSKHETLTSYRHGIHELVPRANVTRADIGLMQLGKTFDGWKREKLNQMFTVAELMDPAMNLKLAHKLWEKRGFQPWAAYTTPRGTEDKAPYEQFHDRAWSAVQRFLREE